MVQGKGAADGHLLGSAVIHLIVGVFYGYGHVSYIEKLNSHDPIS